MANAMQIYNLLKELFLLLDDGDRRLLSEFNLTVPRYYILVHLGEEPGISSRQLSDYLICDKSNITRLVKGMVADGLVEKKPHESDGRAYRLYLTNEGERIRQQTESLHTGYTIQRLNSCTGQEQDNLEAYLYKIKDTLEAELQFVTS